MSEDDYTSKHDNFLKYILALRKLVSRIQQNRENLKADFENLTQLIDKIKFLVENEREEQNH